MCSRSRGEVCPMPNAQAPGPMPHAPCPRPHAPGPMPHAPGPMPVGQIVPHVTEKGYMCSRSPIVKKHLRASWHGRPACSSEAVTKSTQDRRQSYLLRLHKLAIKTNSFILKSPRFRYRLPQMSSLHIVLNSPHQIYN